jgi:hypothetical protein
MGQPVHERPIAGGTGEPGVSALPPILLQSIHAFGAEWRFFSHL